MAWTLPDPALAQTVASPDLPTGWAAEPKWDGYRALLHVTPSGVVLRSRRGTDLSGSFPEIVSAAQELPAGVAVDSELVVWESGRLSFERLQERAARSRTAPRAAREHPAHLVVFDLLHDAERSLLRDSYAARRQALEAFFVQERLGPPWTLCPSTTDPEVARGWLDWSVAGLEGLVFKRLRDGYPAGRRGPWRKFRVRSTADAVVGGVTGSMRQPSSLLLGLVDEAGALRYVGRTTPLATGPARELGAALSPAARSHPWHGWSFSAAWGSRDALDVTLVAPLQVVEVSGDVARDRAGRWRHPVRYLRYRTDMAPSDASWPPA